jgi:glycerol-3-phosphate acyltransferase PlsX
MRVAIDLVKSGQAQACVSAGNTGALMATARFVLKMLPGIDRPAIISALPNIHGKVWVLDLGANVDCQAEHLVQFANMGSVLVSALDNNSKPRVGLLNIGSEAIKGSEVVKAAAQQLLDTSELNYIGYVEGNDIYMGQVDVVVCDGFVGNVALKVREGLAKIMKKTLKQKFMSSLYARLTALLAAPVLKSIQTLYDPARYNGAIFLGLKGIVIKSHGNADPRAFSFAIQAAIRAAQYQTHVF